MAGSQHEVRLGVKFGIPYQTDINHSMMIQTNLTFIVLALLTLEAVNNDRLGCGYDILSRDGEAEYPGRALELIGNESCHVVLPMVPTIATSLKGGSGLLMNRAGPTSKFPKALPYEEA
jgi:hypothetical protein